LPIVHFLTLPLPWRERAGVRGERFTESRQRRDPLDPLPSREGKRKVIDCGKEVGVNGIYSCEAIPVAIKAALF
jgi:hypothetical protein